MIVKPQVHKQWISGFLLALFAAFYFNIGFFSHVHIIDGKKITHSHFHNRCHNNTCDYYCCAESERPPLSGGHSQEELIFIAQKSALETSGIALQVFVSELVATVCEDTKFFLSEHPEVGFYTSFFLRGPPLTV
ncbi:MAG: hypothetical protein FWD02_02955 [Bacteroidales bacterium]|nr:hypothetical protein [Bacteroidales bacterium]